MTQSTDENPATPSSVRHSQLGRDSEYPQSYDAGLLFPVPRRENRASLGLSQWPHYGLDRWFAYELSWLQPGGLPAVAMASIDVPAISPNIIESKSLKLYLNSLNMHEFSSSLAVEKTLEMELSAVAGSDVTVKLHSVETALAATARPEAILLDDQNIKIDHYQVASDLLKLQKDGESSTTETVYSHLLRSNCPVTGQPDWGTLFVRYHGPAICHEGLLRYLVSFRTHTEFHEHCVERVFTDLLSLGDFQQLQVWAHYVRRGGLDINPCRSLTRELPELGRLARQ